MSSGVDDFFFVIIYFCFSLNKISVHSHSCVPYCFVAGDVTDIYVRQTLK